MSTERTYVDALRDIRVTVDLIANFISNMSFEQFNDDTKTTYAVVRALEVIGEAAKSIPVNVQREYPDVPWRQMAGMRDKLIHPYFGVDVEVIWRTATEDIPALAPQIDRMLTEKRE